MANTCKVYTFYMCHVSTVISLYIFAVQAQQNIRNLGCEQGKVDTPSPFMGDLFSEKKNAENWWMGTSFQVSMTSSVFESTNQTYKVL